MSRTRARIVFVALLCSAGVVLAQGGRFDDVQIEVVPVRDGIHMLKGAGGNIGVSSGPDGVFLVDDQFAPLADKILAAVRTIDDGPVRFVINTHYHRDHTNGNELMAKANVLVVAHDNVRRRLTTEEWIRSLDEPALGLPVVTFNDEVTFHLNGDEIHAFHVPRAHTDGDTIVHFRRANVIHMGDILWNGLYPYIDVDAGGDVDGVIEAVELALRVGDQDTRYISGHGPIADRARVLFFRDMLLDIRRRIAVMKYHGKTLEQIQAAGVSQAYDEEWGNAFISPDALAEAIYRSLDD